MHWIAGLGNGKISYLRPSSRQRYNSVFGFYLDTTCGGGPGSVSCNAEPCSEKAGLSPLCIISIKCIYGIYMVVSIQKRC